MENRAQQFKPGNFPLGQVHEWLGVFGRQGGAPDLLQKAIEDQELMRRVVDFWRTGRPEQFVWPPTFLNNPLMRAHEIMGRNFFGVEEAIKHFGVQPTRAQFSALAKIPFTEVELRECKDGHILVARFPLSVLHIRGKVERKLFYSHEDAWYNKEPFALERREASWQLVRKTPVPDSTAKSWQEQQALLGKNDEVPTAQVMVYTIIGHFLATGERLFGNIYVRCSDVSSVGNRVGVGAFGSAGLSVDYGWGEGRGDGIGLASSRKVRSS